MLEVMAFTPFIISSTKVAIVRITSALAKAMNLSEDEITIMLKEAMKALYKDEESEEK